MTQKNLDTIKRYADLKKYANLILDDIMEHKGEGLLDQLIEIYLKGYLDANNEIRAMLNNEIRAMLNKEKI